MTAQLHGARRRDGDVRAYHRCLRVTIQVTKVRYSEGGCVVSDVKGSPMPCRLPSIISNTPRARHVSPLVAHPRTKSMGGLEPTATHGPLMPLIMRSSRANDGDSDGVCMSGDYILYLYSTYLEI